MKLYRRTILSAAVVALLLTATFILRFVQMPMPEHSMLKISLRIVRYIVHIGLIVAWIVSVNTRIIQKPVRFYLISAGLLMLFWLTVRACKWEFSVEFSAFNRYCWYAYYIPIIMIPLLGFFVVDYIGKPENYVQPRRYKLLYIPAVLLIAAVFTNDYHRLAFEFPNGIENFSDDYTYGFIYIIILVWFVGFGIYFLVSLLMKCHTPGSRLFKSLPVIVMCCAVVFWVSYGVFRFDCDLTAISCLIITLLVESAIQSGLIRSNSCYTTLFRTSTIASQIVDPDYNVCYTSGQIKSFDKDSILKTANGDYRLGSAEITGGYVLWLDDISQMNQLTRQLQSASEQLSENNSLLRAELELKEQQARVDEQTRIYDRMMCEMTKQLDSLDVLLKKAKTEPGKIEEILPQICVISAYIKRRGNLLLLGETGSRISARELEFCFRESTDNLQLNGIVTSLNSGCNGEFSTDLVVAVYDYFEQIIEENLAVINAVIIHLTAGNGEFTLNLGIGITGEFIFSDFLILETFGCEIAFEVDETDANMQIRFSERRMEQCF